MRTGHTEIGPAQLGRIIPKGTRVDVFSAIFDVFLVLGTLVGIVVIGYMLYLAYEYRDSGDRDDVADEDRPQLGELPEGGGKGRKLFLSFSMSAIIVISLVAWGYAVLLYVEDPWSAQATSSLSVQSDRAQEMALDPEEPLAVKVTGMQFSWEFTYPAGHDNTTLVVPADRRVQIVVTSADVMHNFGIPGLDVKTDAIPDTTTRTWFEADETGTYQAVCYELCGTGHTYMTATVEVVDHETFAAWYERQAAAHANETTGSAGENATAGAGGGNGNHANIAGVA